MESRDTALGAFDLVADVVRMDETAADELFAVIDLLEGRPPLRHSLSDPSASGRDRQALARRLSGGRLGTATLPVAAEVAYRLWPSGRTMIDTIERRGVHSLLHTASKCRELRRAQEELHKSVLIIDGSLELSDALRSRGRALTDRCVLIARLPAGQVAPVTGRLTSRAAAARACTVPLAFISYLALATDLAGERTARVTAARPPSRRYIEWLRRALEVQVGGLVLLQITVDESVIGDMSIDLETHVFESTTAEQLDEARRLLN